MYLFQDIPDFAQTNSTNTIEPIGMMLFDTKKSKKSKIPEFAFKI